MIRAGLLIATHAAAFFCGAGFVIATVFIQIDPRAAAWLIVSGAMSVGFYRLWRVRNA